MAAPPVRSYDLSPVVIRKHMIYDARTAVDRDRNS